MFILLPFIAFSLHAQELVVPVQVMARQQSLLQHTSSPIWRALEEDLQETTQLQDVLNKAPGIGFVQNGGIGGVGSFYARGSESRHLLVLTDGIRLNDPSSPTRNFDSAFTYTPFFQELLYLRGPAPALYGGDATSGVVELIPRRGGTPPQTRMSFSGGSFDTLQGHVLQDWQTDHHQGSVGLAHLRTRGFSRLNRKRHGAREADGAETTQFMQASRHAWSANLSTELSLLAHTGMAEQDQAFGSTGTDTNDDRTENRQATVTQTTRGVLAQGDWWLKAGMLTLKREIFTGAFDPLLYQAQTRLIQGGMRWETKPFEFIFGFEGQAEWQDNSELKKQNDTGSLFALARWKKANWILEAGGRGEQHQRYGHFAAVESTVSYRPSEEWSWHAKTARGYKTPSLYQLYAPNTYGPVGNSQLEPETNVAWEAGVEWQRTGLVSLVAFQQDFQNLIDYSVDAGYQQRGTLRVQGLEAQVVSPEHFWGQVSVTWTQLDFDYATKAPLRRAPYLGVISHHASLGRWSTELSLRAVGGRRDEVDSQKVGLVAYELLSGALKWNPDQSHQWSLRLGNITDREYEDIWGYGVAPLNASLQWSARY